jgi:hypothetical protein
MQGAVRSLVDEAAAAASTAVEYSSSSSCIELRFAARFGLGNKLLYMMTAAAVARAIRPRYCTIALDAERYGPGVADDLARLLDLHALAAPCKVIGPGDTWQAVAAGPQDNLTWSSPESRREAGLQSDLPGDARLRSTMFTTAYVAAHCRADKPLLLDGFTNYCNMAGWVRLAEHTDTEQWLGEQVARARAAFARSLAALQPPATAPPGLAGGVGGGGDGGNGDGGGGGGGDGHDASERTLCVYYRGREREVGHTFNESGHASTDDSEVASLRTQLAAAAALRASVPFDRVRFFGAYADAPWAVLGPQPDAVLAANGLPPLLYPPPHGLPNADCAAVPDRAGDEGGSGSVCLAQAVRDTAELSRCRAVALDVRPAKVSTFLLVAAMLGGLCRSSSGLLLAREFCALSDGGRGERSVREGGGNGGSSDEGEWVDKLPFTCGQNWWEEREVLDHWVLRGDFTNPPSWQDILTPLLLFLFLLGMVRPQKWRCYRTRRPGWQRRPGSCRRSIRSAWSRGRRVSFWTPTVRAGGGRAAAAGHRRSGCRWLCWSRMCRRAQGSGHGNPCPAAPRRTRQSWWARHSRTPS